MQEKKELLLKSRSGNPDSVYSNSAHCLFHVMLTILQFHSFYYNSPYCLSLFHVALTILQFHSFYVVVVAWMFNGTHSAKFVL